MSISLVTNSMFTAKLNFMELSDKTRFYQLKRNHNIYYDIQGQLHICEKETCLFVIWTSNRYKVFIERVEKDDNFFHEKMENRLISFYNDWLLPELIDPRLKRGMAIREPKK